MGDEFYSLEMLIQKGLADGSIRLPGLGFAAYMLWMRWLELFADENNQ